MKAVAAYAQLVECGCLCGTERPQDCTVHGPGDNRGIAAFFRAGMPNGFPMAATCAYCGADGLLYPSLELDRGEVKAGECPRPTLICPRCSRAPSESALRREAEQSYTLNARTVFGAVAA